MKQENLQALKAFEERQTFRKAQRAKDLEAIQGIIETDGITARQGRGLKFNFQFCFGVPGVTLITTFSQRLLDGAIDTSRSDDVRVGCEAMPALTCSRTWVADRQANIRVGLPMADVTVSLSDSEALRCALDGLSIALLSTKIVSDFLHCWIGVYGLEDDEPQTQASRLPQHTTMSQQQGDHIVHVLKSAHALARAIKGTE